MTMNPTTYRIAGAHRSAHRSALFLVLGALLTAGFLFAPRAEASHQYAVYKCTAKYTVSYRSGTTNSPTADQDKCSLYNVRASFYLITAQKNGYSLVYLDPKNRRFGIVEDCSWDCYGGNNGFKCAADSFEVAMASCTDRNIDINADATDDARRCEILCFEGVYNGAGIPLPAPSAGSSVEFPKKLTGTYCSFTCYDFDDSYWYRVINYKANNYSYDGPYTNDGDRKDEAIACVTGKITCSLDLKLTAVMLDNGGGLGGGEDAVRFFLSASNWNYQGTRDCSAQPYDFFDFEPFLP